MFIIIIYLALFAPTSVRGGNGSGQTRDVVVVMMIILCRYESKDSYKEGNKSFGWNQEKSQVASFAGSLYGCECLQVQNQQHNFAAIATKTRLVIPTEERIDFLL